MNSIKRVSLSILLILGGLQADLDAAKRRRDEDAAASSSAAMFDEGDDVYDGQDPRDSRRSRFDVAEEGIIGGADAALGSGAVVPSSAAEALPQAVAASSSSNVLQHDKEVDAVNKLQQKLNSSFPRLMSGAAASSLPVITDDQKNTLNEVAAALRQITQENAASNLDFSKADELVASMKNAMYSVRWPEGDEVDAWKLAMAAYEAMRANDPCAAKKPAREVDMCSPEMLLAFPLGGMRAEESAEVTEVSVGHEEAEEDAGVDVVGSSEGKSALAMLAQVAAGKKVCKECGKSYNYASDLNRHRRAKHSNQRYVCREPECQEQGIGRYTFISGLNKHMELAHGKKLISSKPLEHVVEGMGKEVLVCPVEGCGKKYKNATSFLNHKKSHKANNAALMVEEVLREKFRCEVPGCGREFASGSSLYRHKYLAHERANKNHKCEFLGCKKVYEEKRFLNEHMRSDHESVKILNLRGCSWSSADELKATVEKHTQLRELLLDFDVVVNGDLCEELIVLNPDLKILAYAVELDEPVCFESEK